MIMLSSFSNGFMSVELIVRRLRGGSSADRRITSVGSERFSGPLPTGFALASQKAAKTAWYLIRKKTPQSFKKVKILFQDKNPPAELSSGHVLNHRITAEKQGRPTAGIVALRCQRGSAPILTAKTPPSRRQGGHRLETQPNRSAYDRSVGEQDAL